MFLIICVIILIFIFIIFILTTRGKPNNNSARVKEGINLSRQIFNESGNYIYRKPTKLSEYNEIISSNGPQNNKGLGVDMKILGYYISKLFPDEELMMGRILTYYYIEGETFRVFIERILLPFGTLFLHKKLIFIPNQEILFDGEVDNLKYINVVLCKTKYCLNIMKKLKVERGFNYTVDYLPFFSPINLENLKFHKRDFVFHPAGASFMKNTKIILKTWLKHPEWPILFVTCRGRCKSRNGVRELISEIESQKQSLSKNKQKSLLTKVKNTSNIYVFSLLNMSDMRLLLSQAMCMILPSNCEGFGHIINEAMGYGTILLASNAPPMNEFFLDRFNAISIKMPIEKGIDSGYVSWLDKSYDASKAGSKCFFTTEKYIEEGVNRYLEMTNSDLLEMVKNAHNSWIQRTDYAMKEIPKVLSKHLL